MTEKELRSSVRDAGLRLQEEGLIARTWGNVSVRLDAKRMLITPSGIPYRDITPEMIVAVDIDTDEWQGNLKPSGERKLHAAIYRLRADVNSVIHTHQNAASIFAACGQALSLENDKILCAPYALPSTKKLTVGTSAALGKRNAAFMANHGVVCSGATIEDAFQAAKSLEESCSHYLTKKTPTLPARPDLVWDNAWLSTVPADSLLGTVLGKDSTTLVSKAPYTVAFSKLGQRMPAVLDDIAQIIGPGVSVLETLDDEKGLKRIRKLVGNGSVLVNGEGAVCSYSNFDDAEAAAMVIEKTARAIIAGKAIGGAHIIPAWEAVLMRFVYKNAYSKQATKAR